MLPLQRRGQATLTMVFLMGGVMIAAGVTLALLYLGFVNSAYGYQLSQRAASTAIAGAEDALLQLSRGKTVAQLGAYQISLDDGSTSVQVSQNGSGQTVITSTSRVLLFSRSIEVVASMHPITNEIQVVSWKFI